MASRVDLIRGHLGSPAIIYGDVSEALSDLTLGDLIRHAAAARPDHMAVISHWQERKLTYKELDAQSTTLAKSFIALGITKGDRVGICAGNCIEYVLTTFAVAKAGAILVVINPSYTPDELGRALVNVKVKLMIISSSLGTRSFESHITIAKQVVSRTYIIRKQNERTFNLPSFETLLDDRSADLPMNLSPHDVVNLQFTSGTTGPPKAASLTHHNILNNGKFIGDRMALTDKDILCIPVPLFHCFGMVLGNLAAFTHQSCVVYPSEVFDRRAVLGAIQKYSCTALHGVPTMFIAILELLESETFETGSLRTGIAAGTVVNAELMSRIQKKLRLPELTITYGMTETSPASTMTSTVDPMIKRTTTVGKVMPHTIVKIVDPDLRTVARGETGEVLVSGYLLQKGYWNDEGASKECLCNDDGRTFMKTGDIGSIDDEGYLSISNRIKDLIIRGGENISPSEVENALAMHGDVLDVSVVAVKNDRYGEVPAAFVKLVKDASVDSASLIVFARTKLAHYKVPAHIFFLGPNEDFPKTASGKIQKFLLRERGDALLDSGK